ncbi:unnamed protein product [Blepharisma stoltei]|uniref:Uncharacterized protein n=1 Tax=Blepharisma stoltei TaxID=1481888 RepID=A0AAU9KGJ2_9CILI|nr:unnamed protein product [Blepharisma stoltei]
MEGVTQQVDTATAVKKLKDQNEYLKKELSDMKSRLHKAALIIKDSERKLINADVKDSQYNSIITHINNLKKTAFILKTEIAANYSEDIPKLENEVKFLKNQLKIIDNEMETLQEVKKKQEARLVELAIPNELTVQAKSVREEIKTTRTEYRDFRAKAIEDQHKWKELHEQWVNLDGKIKEFESSKNNKDGKPKETAEENAMKELNKKQKIFNKAIAQDEIKTKRIIIDQEVKLQRLKEEDEVLKRKLNEKEQEVQLKIIKIKELKNVLRQVQSNKKGIAINNGESDTNTFLTSVVQEIQAMPALTPHPISSSTAELSSIIKSISPEPEGIDEIKELSKTTKENIYSKPYLKFR